MIINREVDPLVVFRGAAAGLLLAVPAAMASVVLSDQEDRSQGLLALAYLVVVAGFAVAAYTASHLVPGDSRQPGGSRQHAMSAALTAYVPVQAIGVLGRLDRGDRVSIPAIVVLLVFAVLAGNTGGVLEARRSTRSPQP